MSGRNSDVANNANGGPSDTGFSGGGGAGSSQSSKGLYGKELRCMMYGFGDDKNPYTESVELLEELVLKYIEETTYKAMEVKKTGKITVEDIMYLVRKDKRKCDRVKELLLMNEELKRSRKAFDLDNIIKQR